MKYEIVELETKFVVGKSIITSNNDPKLGEQIGKMWCDMYDNNNGYYGKIKNKVGNAIGLYSDYMGDKYTLTVGVEVAKTENPELIDKTIVKGKYAKFAIHGNIVTAVVKAWGEIWKTPLDRTFTGDFEEYLPFEKCEDCNINIYIAIK